VAFKWYLPIEILANASSFAPDFAWAKHGQSSQHLNSISGAEITFKSLVMYPKFPYKKTGKSFSCFPGAFPWVP
jgi:hypothetical protein